MVGNTSSLGTFLHTINQAFWKFHIPTKVYTFLSLTLSPTVVATAPRIQGTGFLRVPFRPLTVFIGTRYFPDIFAFLSEAATDTPRRSNPRPMVHRPHLSRSLMTVFLALAALTSAFGQAKYSVQKCEMAFTSNAELELIKASSNQVQGLIDPATNQFAFTVDIKTFQGFNSALQREHFNEKYMESDKYPRARFSGKIIEPVDLKADGTYNVRAKGDLDIHGKKQTRIIKSTITVSNGTLTVKSRFFVPLADHNISIPAIVSQKIATEIEVDFKATMSLQSL